MLESDNFSSNLLVGIFCNEIELLHSRIHQVPRFVEDMLPRL